ncbi:MAG: hypothetical protein J6I47_00995 [Ruminococcus sp.]|nr:hypothetical protein [Ruminococcus sp.]
MTIRKDLDDMLNSLKTGGQSPADAEKRKPIEEKHVQKKSIYDSMSVDDLLSALNAEKKQPEPVQEQLQRPQQTEVKPAEPVSAPVQEQFQRPQQTEIKPAEPVSAPVQEQFQRPQQTEIKPAEPVSAPVQEKRESKPVSSDIPELHLASAVHAEPVTIQETVNVISRAPEITEPKKVIFDTAKNEHKRSVKPAEEKPSDDAEKPEAPKRKKRIVITGELPDYEAIRQRELEKDRLAREKAEAEKAAEEAAQVMPEPVPVIEPAENAFPAEEQPEVTEEKSKKSIFSKIKDKFKVEELGGDMPDPEPPVIPVPVEKDEVGSFIDEVNAEAEETAYQPINEEEFTEPEPEIEPAAEEELPSADELLDAALAAINAADNQYEASEEVPSEPEIPETEQAEKAEETAEETESDPVNSIISDMREDAANAIADLDKPREEKQAEQTASADEGAEVNKTETVKKEEKPEKKGVLKKILDEDPEELLNECSEKSEADEENPESSFRNIRFKKTLYTVLGAVFAVFAVIGIIVSVSKCVSTVRSFTSGEVKKDGFNEIVYPAVIMDIESFNSPAELSSEQIITASIWSIIMDEDRVSKYTVNPGTDTISIPYMDVEARAVEMFGTEHPAFEHCTVGPVDSRFFYSEGAYNVKIKPITFTYSPEIKSIVKSGSTYTVSVDYVDELPEWMDKSVSKSVEFKLTEHDDNTYSIDSMKIEYVKSSNI